MNDLTRNAKRELLEQTLERAAESVGDITGPTMERFYAGFPDARDAFDRLCVGNRQHLEERMVENCLYCMMEWYGRPGEVRGLIEDQIPHHIRTLEVSAEWYWEMLRASLEVIIETIPADAQAERAIWAEMSDGLKTTIFGMSVA